MWYFANPSTTRVRDAMRDHRNHLGMIATPAQGNAIQPAYRWCADNGVFGGTYPGDDAYLAWLDERAAHRGRCQFAVAPDVVGDAEATLARSAPMLARIRRAGYPVALAAQNGLERLTVPWDDFDVLFLGGDTEWKLSRAARGLAVEARRRGKRVHMGRVNSERRLRYAHTVCCPANPCSGDPLDGSADGTYLAFGPDINLPKLLRWLRAVNEQPGLWEVTA